MRQGGAGGFCCARLAILRLSPPRHRKPPPPSPHVPRDPVREDENWNGQRAPQNIKENSLGMRQTCVNNGKGKNTRTVL